MFGAPEGLIREIERPPDAYEVWPENWEAVRIFVAASTQWNQGFSGYTGLNYTALEFLFKIYQVKQRLKVFEQIQIIEGAALGLIREKQESSRGNNGP